MRREETLDVIVLLVTVMIFLFMGDTEARKLNQIQCSSSCGDIEDIRYPFRLKGDPAGCGDHDFELSCQSNNTILEFASAKYFVKKISYVEHIITIVDVNYLAIGSCSLPNNSLLDRSYENGLPDSENGYSMNSPSYAYFVRCSSNISDPLLARLPCMNGNQSTQVYVAYYNLSRGDISDFPKSCSFISAVPMPEYEEYSYGQLSSGFDLVWSVELRDCKLSAEHDQYCFAISIGGQYSYGNASDEEGLYYLLNTYFNLSEILKLSLIFLLLLSFLLRIVFLVLEILLILVFSLPKRFQANIIIFNYSGPSIVDKFYPDAPSFLDLILLAVVAVIFITKIILIMVFVVLFIRKYKTAKKTVDDVEKFLYNQQSWMPKRYSYFELIAITNHFHDKLGQGGFGSVYKGKLLDGRLIAVKVLEKSKFSGEEFINEVSTIGRIHHINVVRLLGFCADGSKRALVYEYMPNGSLDRHIFSKKGNDQACSWEKLHEIALGTARGIEYLHNGCDVCILHFDIKPHNILLDHNFIPKVADFGLAKFYPKENDFVCISATRGTIGYIAPELISRNFGIISSKSDVYSFGMLLLEIVGGRRNSVANATRSSKAYFPSWVYDKIIKCGDLDIPNVNEIEATIARKMCMIGLWCIQMKATDRPSITKVVEMLEGSIDDLQMPPKPFFGSSTPHIMTSVGEIQSESWESESIEEYLHASSHEV